MSEIMVDVVYVNGVTDTIPLTVDPSDPTKATGTDSTGTLHNFANSDGSMWSEVPVSTGGKRRKSRRSGSKKRRGGTKKRKSKSGKKRR